ncbi:MAG TPA: hypothetical protein PKN96_02510, partial [Flavobacterium sp.]|nr:hypothetical protein [Flavobacterium sp.]
MKKNYTTKKQVLLSFFLLFTINFIATAQSENVRHSTYVSDSKKVKTRSLSRITPSTPSTQSTTTVTACGSYTWSVSGQTYTSTGIYTYGGGITQLFNDQTAWTNSATITGATIDFDDLSGIPAAATVDVVIGGTTVSLSAPGGIYSDGTFLGTNNANESITITFSPGIYGISGNFFDTNNADNVISGNVTATYSDGAVDSRTVTADTELFGYLSTTPITSLVLSTTTTTPHRFISLRNLSIATNPTSSEILDLTITPIVTPTFPTVSPICAGSPLSPLPTTSDNGINGTWSPALDNNNTTTYTFTPNVGECATTKDITITVYPIGTKTTSATACSSYRWPVNGITYTTSGSYAASIPLTDTLEINSLSPWIDHAVSFDSTLYADDLGNIVATNPTNITFGATTVSMSAPGGMYNGLDFLGTVNANAPLTITFTPPVYGVDASYFTTDFNDNVVTGNVTITYSNGHVQSRTITSDTDPSGYFDNNSISSIVLTSSTASRYVSLKNLIIATDPHSCTTETLDLTINNGPAPGDTIATAIPVNTPNYTTTGNNLEVNCYTDTGGELSPDVWYKVNLDACAQSLSLNTCTGSNFDTILTVFAADGVTQLAQSDDDCPNAASFQSEIDNLDVSSEDVVYVRVEGYYGLGSEQGTYGLEISQALLPQTVTTFSPIADICNGDALTLPTTSNNGIPGTWSPAIDNTTTTTYTFTPNPDQCATTASLT